ncbi:MAG: hypothetical protein ACKO0M_13140 [Cyanobium sp.]
MELSTAQRFELERLSRAIDATADPEELRLVAKQLLRAWHTQKAATNWMIRQQMDSDFTPRPGTATPDPQPPC